MFNKTKLLSLLVLASVSLVACETENVLQEKDLVNLPEVNLNDPLVQEIIAMGFQKDKIIDIGNSYLVEGDIEFPKSSSPKTNKGNNTVNQYYLNLGEFNKGLVTRENVRNITVRLDSSVPQGGSDGWLAALQTAIGHYNNLSECIIKFELVQESQDADIMVVNDFGELDEFIFWGVLGRATLPSGGKPGELIKLNMSIAPGSLDGKVGVLLHELGHTIGLRHTDWLQNGQNINPIRIEDTAPSGGDSHSIMWHSGVANRNYFSANDIKALKTIYGTYQREGVFGYAKNGVSQILGADITSYNFIDNSSGISYSSQNGDWRNELLYMACIVDNSSAGYSFNLNSKWDINVVGEGLYSFGYLNNSFTGMQLPYGNPRGVGIDFGNIGGDPDKLDLVLMACDWYGNSKYKIIYDLASDLQAGQGGVSNEIIIPSFYDGDVKDASISIGNINGNALPDLVFARQDDNSATKRFRYKIGFDLNSNGVATSWSGWRYVDDFPKDINGGFDITIIEDPNIWSLGKKDIVFTGYHTPNSPNIPPPAEDGEIPPITYPEPIFMFKAGFDLDNNGIVSNWSNVEEVRGVNKNPNGVNRSLGVGIAFGNIDDNPFGKDLIFMSMVEPEYDGPVTFRSRFGSGPIGSSGIFSQNFNGIGDIFNVFGNNNDW